MGRRLRKHLERDIEVAEVVLVQVIINPDSPASRPRGGRGMRRRASLAPPPSVGPAQPASGARTPSGVLVPGASPRVRPSRRSYPRHRKWLWWVGLQILG